jgi:hypothetical protein
MISGKAGLLNHLEGNALLNGYQIMLKPGEFPQMKEGDTFWTDAGRGVRAGGGSPTRNQCRTALHPLGSPIGRRKSCQSPNPESTPARGRISWRLRTDYGRISAGVLSDWHLYRDRVS